MPQFESAAGTLRLLAGKDVRLGVIDVATDTVETRRGGRRDDREALHYVPRDASSPAPMRHGADAPRIAEAKLTALGAGARSPGNVRLEGSVASLRAALSAVRRRQSDHADVLPRASPCERHHTRAPDRRADNGAFSDPQLAFTAAISHPWLLRIADAYTGR